MFQKLLHASTTEKGLHKHGPSIARTAKIRHAAATMILTLDMRNWSGTHALLSTFHVPIIPIPIPIPRWLSSPKAGTGVGQRRKGRHPCKVCTLLRSQPYPGPCKRIAMPCRVRLRVNRVRALPRAQSGDSGVQLAPGLAICDQLTAALTFDSISSGRATPDDFLPPIEMKWKPFSAFSSPDLDVRSDFRCPPPHLTTSQPLPPHCSLRVETVQQVLE
jgi:hypothetical protein